MKINSTNQTNLENVKTFTNQRETNFEPLFQYGNFDQDNNKKDISDAKIVTENFKDQIMGHLDTSKSTKSIDTVKYYLNKLVEIVQILNGIQKNNLKPQGNSEQNRIYNGRIQEMNHLMKDYVEFIGSGLSIVQDSKSGLYKLSVNNKQFDVPERNIEIITEQTIDGTELMPAIVD